MMRSKLKLLWHEGNQNRNTLRTLGCVCRAALACSVAAITLTLWATLASGQQTTGSNTKEFETQTTSGLTGTLTFKDALGTKANTWEMVVAGGPATVAVTINGCMRGGTCTVLGTSSATTNTQIATSGGPYDNYQIAYTLTGGASPSLTFNRTGSAASLPSALPATNAQGMTPVSGTAANSYAAQKKSPVDIRDFYLAGSGTTGACALPCVTADIGVALQNIFASYGSGVVVDLCGLTVNAGGGRVFAYTQVDPWANIPNSKFQSRLLAKCNVTVVTSATWHTDSSGGTVIEGAPAPVVPDATNTNGFRLYPCALVAGCGPVPYPQFPNSLATPKAGTAVAIGHNSRGIMPTQLKSTNPTAGAACNGTTETCATVTSGSATVTCQLTDAQGGCGWDVTVVGGWFMPASNQLTFGAGDAAYQAMARTDCFKYINAFTSGGGGAGHDTLTLALAIDNGTSNCAVPAAPGSGQPMEWLIAKPNANVVLWMGFNSTETDCFGTKLIDVNMDLIGLPNGIGVYSNSCQEATYITYGNWMTNGNSLGVSGSTRWTDGDPYAPLVFDDSFVEGGNAGASHFHVYGLRIAEGTNGGGGSGVSDGFLFNCWEIADSKSAAGISEANFDTITGKDSTHRLHNGGTIDGCASGNVTFQHVEWVSNFAAELGPNFRTGVTINYINAVNLVNATGGVVQMDAAGATVGNCVMDFSTNVGGVFLINDLANSVTLKSTGTALGQNSAYPYCQPGVTGGSGPILAGNTVRLTSDVTGITATTPATGTIVLTIPVLSFTYNFNASCHLLYQQAVANGGIGLAFKHASQAPAFLLATGRVFTNIGGASPITTGQNASTTPGTTATQIVLATPAAAVGTTQYADIELQGEENANAAASLQIIAYTQAGADAVSVMHGSYCSIHP